MGDRSPAKMSTRPVFLKRRTTPRDSTLAARQPLDKGNMAASFLQYCAMCERQITTPSNSILYCSEACRRKDGSKPLSASYTPSTSMPSSPRPIKVNRFLTESLYTTAPSIRIPIDLHDHKSDLDPTEWKPKLPTRETSEAHRYLSQFHQVANTSEHDGVVVRVERPTLTHKTTMSLTTTPSLGNTPTTVASSVDSYDFNTRHLPPRQNPAYAPFGAMKSVDLVTPHVAPPITVAASVPIEGAHYYWEKKTVVVKGSADRGDGLSALFGGLK